MGLATAYFGRAQQTATSTPLPVTVAPITGGTLHGVIKDGAVPLPGVTVTATNTLTGKRYATTSDITGAWSMRIPSNGRYVLRTEFTAFAASTHEVLLNAASHERSRRRQATQMPARSPRLCANWPPAARRVLRC
jgi:hypothetical protein